MKSPMEDPTNPAWDDLFILTAEYLAEMNERCLENFSQHVKDAESKLDQVKIRELLVESLGLGTFEITEGDRT